MRKTERLIALLLVLALAAACMPAAADSVNFRKLFSMPKVELLNADGLTITAGGEVREEYTLGKKKRVISYYIPISVTNTSDKLYQVFFPEEFLNGRYVGSSLINSTSAVKPGQTFQFALDLSCDVLEAYGVTSLNQIQSLDVKVKGYSPDGTYREFGTIRLSAKLLGLSLKKAARIPNADEITPQTLFEADGLGLWTDGLTPDGKGLSFRLYSNRAEIVRAYVQNIIVNGWQIPYKYNIDIMPGDDGGCILEFGDHIPDFSGLASASFDLDVYCAEDIAYLSSGEGRVTRLCSEPVRISLAPAHPAEIPGLEGWTLAAEQDGLQVLYRGGFSQKKSDVLLSVMFINTSDRNIYLTSMDEPCLLSLPKQLQFNGQPSALDGSIECFPLVGPGAKSAATLSVRNKLLTGAGIKWKEIRSVDFTLFIYPGKQDAKAVTLPVHIDLE